MDEIEPGTSTYTVLQTIKDLTECGPSTPKFSESLYEDEEDSQISGDVTLEAVEKVEEDVPNQTTAKKPKPPKKVVEQYSDINYQNTNLNMHIPFNPSHWTAQMNYRMPHDIVIGTIRNNGTEGLARTEIGYALGYDANLKPGSRRVSQYIITANGENNDHIGQYQKMEGKLRSIRYYWKESEQPEKFEKLMKDFEVLTGIPCPFKIGEVVKFPDVPNLNTLRVSDISLQRLYRILRVIESNRVVVTTNRMLRFIAEEEASEGYKYSIDKKSLTKCLLALKRKNLLQCWDTIVTSDLVDYTVQIMAHRDVKSVDDTEVQEGIQSILDEYHRECRVFPHGQLRLAKNRIEKAPEKEELKIGAIDENLDIPRTIPDRYDFFRLQVVRNSWNGKTQNKKDADDSMDIGEDETMVEEFDEENIHEFSLVYNNVTPAPGKKAFNQNYYVGRNGFGYQSKAVRLFVMHQFVYHFVYGVPEEKKLKTLYDLFPPTQPFAVWPSYDENNAPIFATNNLKFRFVPPQPVFSNFPEGWFMLQDLIVAMPLSTLAICAFLPKKIDKTFLFHYLNHPDRRHLCIGHLPSQQREILLRDKKIAKQIEYLLCLLGSLGLAAIGPNPSVKRFPGVTSEMFWLSKHGILHDTSTSDKGYAAISSEYNDFHKYDYDFVTSHDVTLFWHHLRAIVQSTPLAFRLEEHSEQTGHRHYGAGYFDKKQIEREWESIERCHCPIGPRDGVAGFDSALFMHLKRNWDMTTYPSSATSWFIAEFRNDAELLKPIVEGKVAQLQKDWNSFMKTLMPTDLDLTKSKMQTVNSIAAEFTMKQVRKKGASDIGVTSSHRPKQKKRKMDSIDCISNANRVFIRCRFSSKERDQLIMIRAVGFFLNPVYRFWLDPTVLRDLMHEFVPESRTKTVQSLMACGVRELVRPNRLAYLQRIVRNLSTFPEMRELRWQLCTAPVSPIQTKTEFFKDAYRLAMKLLFADNSRIPHTMVTDQAFNDFLKQSSVLITKETVVNNPLPYRSQLPRSLSHIQHCIGSNLLLSVLIHSTNGDFAESVLSQISPTILQNVLQSLRSDGLVSRMRQGENDLVSRNQATLSYYFRHFFSHRYHPELIDASGSLLKSINNIEDSMAEDSELYGDSPSVLVAASTAFFDDRYELDMVVDDDIMEAFDDTENDQTTKKIRYLESANLHFEKIHVHLDRTISNDAEEGDEYEIDTSLQDVNEFLEKAVSTDEPIPYEEWIDQFEEPLKSRYQSTYDIIESKSQTGATLQDLVIQVEFSAEILLETLSFMYNERQIIQCGVDQTRWATTKYENVWKITFDNKRWTPRPWITPTGNICLSTVRWMCESVLLTIVSKFGIQLTDLHFQYEFAIQPVVLREIIQILEILKCVEMEVKEYASQKLSSPFDESSEKVSVSYLVPTPNCLERFSRIFQSVSLLSTMMSKNTDDAKR